jgi:ATP-dependent Zn protease
MVLFFKNRKNFKKVKIKITCSATYIMIKMTKSRKSKKSKKKNKIRIKKKYLIDTVKYKGIYCKMFFFFIGKQKIILFPKFRKNGWVSIVFIIIIIIIIIIIFVFFDMSTQEREGGFELVTSAS